jgi:hypothetical protein
MSITGAWYESTLNPANTSDPVGGARSANPLSGLLGELFEDGYSPLLGEGPYIRYRKVFFLNQGSALVDAKAFFHSLTHIDQVSFAFEKTPGDQTVNTLTMPAGYTTGDFSCPVGLVEGISIPGGGGVPATTGEVAFWIREYIPEGLSPETGAFARLRIAGRYS